MNSKLFNERWKFMKYIKMLITKPFPHFSHLRECLVSKIVQTCMAIMNFVQGGCENIPGGS